MESGALQREDRSPTQVYYEVDSMEETWKGTRFTARLSAADEFGHVILSNPIRPEHATY